VEDIEAKIDLLLDMYKEDRTHTQMTTSSASEKRVLDEHRAAGRTAADERHQQPSEPNTNSPQRCASIKVTSSSEHRAVPMLRNLSDLGPRMKKRVTYSSTSDNRLTAVTLDCKQPVPDAALPQQQPSIVSEEDEFSVGPQSLSSVAVDDVKSCSTCTSDTSSADVNIQSDIHCVQRLSYADVVPHYTTTPAQQTDFDTNAQLYQLPTFSTNLM